MPPEGSRKMGWWKREGPVLRIGIVLGNVLAVAVLGVQYWGLIDGAVWGVLHQHRMIYRGVALKLPSMWRPDGEWHPYGSFGLVRGHSGAGSETVIASAETTAAVDVEKRFEVLETMNRRMVAGSETVLADDPVGEAGYGCMGRQVAETGRLSLLCLSRDGHWFVSFRGMRDSLPDLRMMLEGIAGLPAMGVAG
jgi:hypothetical protein